jgi:hypothetical protein
MVRGPLAEYNGRKREKKSFSERRQEKVFLIRKKV